MASINANHDTRGYKYFEVATSIRIDKDIVKKIFIRYIGKNPSHVDLEGIRFLTPNHTEGNDILHKANNLKEKIKSINEKEFFKGPGKHEIFQKKYSEALATTIATHGFLNESHLHWLQQTLKKENPTLDDLDKHFEKKIKNADKITSMIFTLTGKESKDYFDNLDTMYQRTKELEELRKRQYFIADLGGYGGAYDENKEGTEDEFKTDKAYDQDSISSSIRAIENEIKRLDAKNSKFESKYSKELKQLGEILEKNQINELQLNMDIDFDHRHHINDVMEVYANAKRYKILQLAKLKFRDKITSDKEAIKMQFINEVVRIETFKDLQNTYARSFTFDYVSDYLDSKIFKPIALKSWEKGNTKEFLNLCVKKGFFMRQFVAQEKGNTRIHYLPNFIDPLTDGKHNLLRKYSNISKASVARLLNKDSLNYVEKIIDDNKELRQFGKKPYTFKQLNKIYAESNQNYGIKNSTEFAFMMSLVSQKDIRDAAHNAIDVFKVSEIFGVKEVLKKSVKEAGLHKEPKKSISKDEHKIRDEEIAQLKEFYGDDWKQVLGI